MPPRPIARRIAEGGLALACTLPASLARAQGGVALRVDCPALDEASLGALEARSRAELALAALPTGEVAIACSAESASLSWQPAGGARREVSVRLEPDRTGAVEAILEALDGLLAEKQAPPAEDTPSVPESAPPAVKEPEPPAAVPNPPQAAEAVGATMRSPSGVALAVGMDSELWSGAIAGGIGPHAGIRLRASGSWSATLNAGALWGTSAPDGISARTLRVLAGIDCDVLPQFRIGVGADARMLLLAAQDASASTTQAETAGAVVTARYVVRFGALGLSVGPDAEFLVRPLIVQVAGSELFRVPTAMIGLVVEASVEPAW